MLTVLYEIEHQLPKLLKDRSHWQSVLVDYHAPFVERLWMPVGSYRVYLHKIYPCDASQALFHPHPWPSAMRIVDGEYEMSVGYGKGMIVPPTAATMILSTGSCYEMIDPDGWHYVRPLGKPTLSLMVTGTPWKRESHKSTKQLYPLAENVAEELLRGFSSYYH